MCWGCRGCSCMGAMTCAVDKPSRPSVLVWPPREKCVFCVLCAEKGSRARLENGLLTYVHSGYGRKNSAGLAAVGRPHGRVGVVDDLVASEFVRLGGVDLGRVVGAMSAGFEGGTLHLENAFWLCAPVHGCELLCKDRRALEVSVEVRLIFLVGLHETLKPLRHLDFVCHLRGSRSSNCCEGFVLFTETSLMHRWSQGEFIERR